jgi:hypothetical protein
VGRLVPASAARGMPVSQAYRAQRPDHHPSFVYGIDHTVLISGRSSQATHTRSRNNHSAKS